ncbi:hypothetical protein K0504_16070 [Neiella marina]|uniref:Ferrous iron transport protein A n=1 Tax=Neiella holothuriorum TaxID=2870530 RepID=A0ABS7EJM3_9GAMM|nr:hypothetical protein [Neiella holothuriorum]MBW8192557.1 hypothetical protein [Neiella holothuriorum]
MDTVVEAEIERRGSNALVRLTQAQELSVHAMQKLGWDIWFVRMTQRGPLAVLCRGEAICTVDHLGNASFSPTITIRQHD